MKKVILASALSLSLGSFGAFADTISGYISESGCGAKHSAVSDANTKCIQGCLKKGSDAVLVSDGKVYKFDDASKDKAKALAGKEVSVDGSISGDMVTATAISAK
jgi:hypothetical protein